MSVVVDASALLPLILAGEDAALAEATLRAVVTDGGMAPAILWFEIRNALVVNERRGRITADDVAGFLAEVDALPILLQELPNSDEALALARRHHLSVYDAVYLELAKRTNSLLATLDERLRDAARGEGVSIFE